MTMISTSRIRGEKVTVRLPQELVDGLPSGKDLSDRVRNALWQIRDLTNGKGPLAEMDKRLTTISDRLAAPETTPSSSRSDPTKVDANAEAMLAILAALGTLGDDLIRLQRLFVPIYRYIEDDRLFSDERTVAEVDQLEAELKERNRRLIDKPREQLAARLLDGEA